MAEFGFIKSMYGNDTYYPDSALKRYSRYHNSGSTWIFNNFGGYSDGYGSCGCGTSYSAGCCGGGGWGRGLFGGLLGAAAGALVAGGLYSVGRWIFNGGLKGLFKREEKPQDTTPNNGNGNNQGVINDLRARLDEALKKIEELTKTKADGPKADGPDANGPKADGPDAEVPKVEVPKVEVPEVETPGDEDIDNIEDFATQYADDISNWATLGAEAKAKVIAKLQALVDKLKAAKDRTGLANIAQDSTLPADLRKIAEQALYRDGYKNWDGDISKLLVDDGKNVVVRAIDVGDPKDIVGPSAVVKTTGELGDRVMITINDKTGPAIYTQIDSLTSDTGEYVFQSTNGTGGTQYYVLQYDEKEKNYKLMQYEHHTGYNIADRAGAES